MKVAVIAETEAGKPRVAATAETVKKMAALGAAVAVQAGAAQRHGPARNPG
jgi:H+-translocating NAD(P) transhydrogenase subunit alpha